MLKFGLLAFLLGFVDAQDVLDICTAIPRDTNETDSFHLIGGNGSQYANNQDCWIFIYSSSLPLIISLDFRYFELEFGQVCQFDYLCVNGVRFCGPVHGTYEFILPELRYVTIVFVTDADVTNRGFDIFVSTRLAGNETITQVDGVVSDVYAGGPFTKQVTYSQDLAANYVDKCESYPSTAYPCPFPCYKTSPAYPYTGFPFTSTVDSFTFTSTPPTVTAPTSTAPTSTLSTSTAPTSTAPTSTLPTSTAPTSTAPTSTTPTSTANTSTLPTSTASTGTAPTCKAPTSTAPPSTLPTSTSSTTTAPTSTAPTSTAPTSTAPTSTLPTSTATTGTAFLSSTPLRRVCHIN